MKLNQWQMYLLLLGAGVTRLPDGRHLSPSALSDSEKW